ncbi:MAG: hypothetical protein ACKOQ7_05645, partial [Actinomycetota bacterium]
MSGNDTLVAESGAERMAVAFARLLRGVDIAAPLDSVLTFVDALSLVGLDDRASVYWAARATLVRRPEDVPAFDRAFAVFWDHRESAHTGEQDVLRVTIAVDTEDEGANDGSVRNDDDPTITLRFSGVETLRAKDFSGYT